MNRKKIILPLLIIGLTTTIVSLIPYFRKFDVTTLSGSSADWANFGSYLAGTIGLIFTLLSIILIAQTFFEQQKSTAYQIFNDVFFKLLDKHLVLSKSFDNSSISSGVQKIYHTNPTYPDSNEFVKHLRNQFESKIDRFYSGLSLNTINELCHANYTPSEDVVFKEEVVSVLVKDIEIIVNFIEAETHLNSSQREAYHAILSNSLRESELFLFGAYICLVKKDKKYEKIYNGYYIKLFKSKTLFDLRNNKNNPNKIFCGFVDGDNLVDRIYFPIIGLSSVAIDLQIQIVDKVFSSPLLCNLNTPTQSISINTPDGLITLNDYIDRLFYNNTLRSVIAQGNNVNIELLLNLSKKGLILARLNFDLCSGNDVTHYSLKLNIILPANSQSSLTLQFIEES